MTNEDSGTRERVGIVSTAPIRLTGLCSVFEHHPGLVAVVGELDTLLKDLDLQYMILDLSQDLDWLETLVAVQRSRPGISQIVLGPGGDDEQILQAILAGARAYLDLNAGPLALRQAVEAVTAGSIWAPRRLMSRLVDRLLNQPIAISKVASPVYSRREQQVLDLILVACSNREIAQELGIEERTVKAYVGSLLRKSGAENRVSLSVLATQNSFRESRLRGESV
jgi:DNA-binding NarL/FixJ family response regulator